MPTFNLSDSSVQYNKSFLDVITTSSHSFLASYVSRIVFVIGILGNSIILVSIIARRLHNKSVIFIYLWVIAAFDTASLLFMQVFDELQQIPRYSDVILTTSNCNIRIFFLFASTKVSVYTLVAVNVFRLYSLCRPLRLNRNANQRCLTFMICLIIIACSFVAHLHVFSGTLERGRMGEFTMEINSQNVSVEVYGCSYVESSQYYTLMVNALFYVALPGVLLFSLSIASLVVLQRHYDSYKQMTLHCGDNSKHNNANRTYVSARITVTLLVPISLLHIVLTIPRYIVLLKECTSTLHSNTTEFAMYYMWSRVVLPLNWALNFYLQTICSKFFRETMLPCFRRMPRAEIA